MRYGSITRKVHFLLDSYNTCNDTLAFMYKYKTTKDFNREDEDTVKRFNNLIDLINLERQNKWYSFGIKHKHLNKKNWLPPVELLVKLMIKYDEHKKYKPAATNMAKRLRKQWILVDTKDFKPPVNLSKEPSSVIRFQSIANELSRSL